MSEGPMSWIKYLRHLSIHWFVDWVWHNFVPERSYIFDNHPTPDTTTAATNLTNLWRKDSGTVYDESKITQQHPNNETGSHAAIICQSRKWVYICKQIKHNVKQQKIYWPQRWQSAKMNDQSKLGSTQTEWNIALSRVCFPYLLMMYARTRVRTRIT